VVTGAPARLALAAGFLAATFAYGAWISTRTALDPGATNDVAEKLLESAPVQETVVEALERHVRAAVATDALDPQVGAAIERALDDPRLIDAFGDAVSTFHRGLLEGRKGAITLDSTEVTASVRDALATIDPALAAEVAAAEPIRIDLGEADVPAISDAGTRARAVLVTATLLAIALLVAGVALHPSQRDALARVGRRIALLAIGPLLGFVVLPWILASAHNDAATMAAGVLEVYAGRVLPSAIVLAVGGIGLWIGARTWPKTPQPLAVPTPTAPRPSTRPYAAVAAERPTEKLYL